MDEPMFRMDEDCSQDDFIDEDFLKRGEFSDHMDYDNVDYYGDDGFISNDEFYKVGISDFDLIRVLGRGGFGKVLQVRKRTAPFESQVFAMKILKKSGIIKSRKETEHTIAERNILGGIKSDFICKLFYAFQTTEKLYFVLEFLEGGELFMLMEKEGTLSELDAAFYSAEIVVALNHLHRCDVIYRDLKPENVMLDRHGHVKLTDFGLCKEYMFHGERAYTYCGTVEYMAPEIILKNGHTFTADWWSLGTIIYDMLTGKPPFTSESKGGTADKIVKGRIQFPSNVSKEATKLIRGLLTKNPDKRLGVNGVKQIQKQAFFRHLNWSDVENRKLVPPFKPVSDSGNDGPSFKYFDPRFFKLPVIDSPSSQINSHDDPFFGFSYTAPEFLDSRHTTPSPMQETALIHSPKPAKCYYSPFPTYRSSLY